MDGSDSVERAMAAPTPGFSRGAGSLAVLIGVFIAALQPGGGPTVPSPTATARSVGAAFDPEQFTIVTTRPIRPGADWSVSKTVRIRTEPGGSAPPRASTHLGSDEGAQIAADVTPDPHSAKTVRENNVVVAKIFAASVRVAKVPTAGEYTGTLSLDPLDPDAAALGLTVKARDHWLWPLLVLFFGAAVSFVVRLFYQAYLARRKEDLETPSISSVGVAVARAFKGAVPSARKAIRAILVHLLPTIRWLNAFLYLGLLLLAAIAFLLPVYTATNFGSQEQYISLFVAGLLGRVLVDIGLDSVTGKSTNAGAGNAEPGVQADPSAWV